MENIYNKFIGKDNYFQKKQEQQYPLSLSRSGSMPLLSPFYAQKLPSNLTGTIPYKKRDHEGITSSDIKVQLLEEKLRKLEDFKNKQILNNQPYNNQNNNIHLPQINYQQNLYPSNTTNNIIPKSY